MTTNPFFSRAMLMLSAAVWLLAVACQKQDATPTNNLTTLPAAVPAPAGNPSSTAQIALGRALFWDPILSGGRDVSCATCHHPSKAYADGLDLSIGVNGQGLGSTRRFLTPNTIPFTQRNCTTVLNTAYNGMAADGSFNAFTAPMFWDNRAQSLEAQALLPIVTLEEMRSGRYPEAAALDSVVARLRHIPAYVTLFQQAFAESTPVTSTNLGKAIAAFERTLVTTDAPYDEYLRGNTSALTAQQVQGLNAFVATGCNKCHSGPMLSDYLPHVLGIADNPKLATSDSGVNGTYAFRTPSLRNVALTAPYMHNGMLATLQDVVNFYDQGGRNGGRAPQNPHVAARQLDPLLPGRVQNTQAIVAFLNTLTAQSYDRTVPTTVPSGLSVGGNIR
ncbi:cytochrome-c peroxidase [Hymenobacter sp. GOD-10R]|uniref:cytochrome-c peroxidase n=1 Tax=Hymenobacter sp. GOD-10R TaxID=3093922 RepID=UPI002D7858ED|nr:cytochrome c peroxidase [Hymenobacter sp. GOD-10R]WRQ31703.1 cytochrome c peroxidase [Hymenobacter sp. GOD-10R]